MEVVVNYTVLKLGGQVSQDQLLKHLSPVEEKQVSIQEAVGCTSK